MVKLKNEKTPLFSNLNKEVNQPKFTFFSGVCSHEIIFLKEGLR